MGLFIFLLTMSVLSAIFNWFAPYALLLCVAMAWYIVMKDEPLWIKITSIPLFLFLTGIMFA